MENNANYAGTPSSGEVAQLLATMEGAAARLSEADMTVLTAGEQFGVLAVLERVDAMRAAVRGQAAAAFDAAGGYEEQGYAGLAPAVQARFKVTKARARSYKTLARRHKTHPLVMAALRGGLVSESWAEQVMTWTETIKDPGHIQTLDEILLTGAAAGLELAELRGLFEEARALLAPPDEDGKEQPDRGLDLVTTLDGAGVLRADLSPECAALLRAGLEALAAKKASPDDDRTYAVRCHDALHQLLKLAIGTGDVPARRGQDTTAIVHIPLHELRQLDGAAGIEQTWGEQARAAWLAELTAAHGAGADGGAWLTGDAARAVMCDAIVAPVVTGHLVPGIFTQIIEVGAELHQLIHERDGRLALIDIEAAAARDRRIGDLFARLCGLAADAVSGPGGLASALRTGMFAGTALGTTSLPLDCGDTDKIKPHLRRAIDLRDPVCAWDGCDRPAMWCEPHHVTPRARHGPTSLTNCLNLCYWHHHYAIHVLGWSITVNAAGIATLAEPVKAA